MTRTEPLPAPSPPPADALRSFLSIVGSLWFGALLLMLLLVGMACATLFESQHGSAFAKAAYYESWWFQALLALVAVNVLAAILARLPITRKRVGFLLTHAGLLVIVAGALLTCFRATDGVLVLQEGETADTFSLRQDALTLLNRRDQTRTVVDLRGGGFGGFEVVNQPAVPPLIKDDLRITVEQYLPDSESVEEVVDDNPRPSPAVEVTLAASGEAAEPVWLFPDQPVDLGPVVAVYREVPDAAKFERLLAETGAANPASVGRVHVELDGRAYDVPVEDCLKTPAPLGDTPYGLRVLRYLPHATVGEDKKLTNASSQPVNPAIEVELAGPNGTQTHTCFAKFPDFRSMHGAAPADDVKITFVATESAAPDAPLEILGGPAGTLHARFTTPANKVRAAALVLGQAAATPWTGRELVVRRRFEHARISHSLVPVSPVRQERLPAIRVKLERGAESNAMWLRRGGPSRLTVDGAPYELLYGDKTRALGFSVTLNSFAVRYYPGGGSLRALESNVTMTNPATGESRTQIVSMNHPAQFGGLNFFQTRYQLGRTRATSILSVARDPGLPVVFAGYVICFGGMVWVLVVRIQERRKLARLVQAAGHGMAAVGTQRRSRVPAALLAGFGVLALPATGHAALPSGLDLSVVRSIPLQQDGRWPPLDTVARDLVHEVTGRFFYEGHDPVLLLLAWTIDPQPWMNAPLIPIHSAELRRELSLPAEQRDFSYAELLNHRPLRQLMDDLANVPRGKLDPLQKKVSDLSGKLGTLDRVFHGSALTVVPDPRDANAAWASLAAVRDPRRTDLAAVRDAWTALERSFKSGDRAAFAQASVQVRDALAALPAAHRPAAKMIEVELTMNRVQPFRMAWIVMAAGAGLAVVSLVMRSRALEIPVVVALIAGFAILTYGLSLRWQVAGRIPASNIYESLLFLSWGAGPIAILTMIFFHDRTVPLTASVAGALALFLADVLPLDSFIRPIVPVLMDTVWMSIHVPVIMVSYFVLAMAMFIAHAQLVVMAAAPRHKAAYERIDTIHYWYVHVGAILLMAGIVTGSMWAASSWGRYWGWDPKEVWSLIALLAYLTILHVRIDVQKLPAVVYAVGALAALAVFVLAARGLAPLTPTEVLALVGALTALGFFIMVHGPFATAVKSVVAFWGIIMTYLGVNFVLGTGLHSYGFGTGAVQKYMFLMGQIDLAFVALCAVVYLARRGAGGATADKGLAAAHRPGPLAKRG